MKLLIPSGVTAGCYFIAFLPWMTLRCPFPLRNPFRFYGCLRFCTMEQGYAHDFVYAVYCTFDSVADIRGGVRPFRCVTYSTWFFISFFVPFDVVFPLALSGTLSDVSRVSPSPEAMSPRSCFLPLMGCSVSPGRGRVVCSSKRVLNRKLSLSAAFNSDNLNSSSSSWWEWWQTVPYYYYYCIFCSFFLFERPN